MSLLQELSIVLGAGVFTAVVCGFGTLPFYFKDDISTRWIVALWGFAGGVMVSASVFGFIWEGLEEGGLGEVGFGFLVGVAVVVVASYLISGYEFSERELPAADFKKLVLIVGVLTVHSFPEGVALGVAFADMPLDEGVALGVLGTVPVLAVVITIAISIQNVPEGLAVAIPLHTYDVRYRWIFAWAVFSSIPQPVGAGVAYVFVTVAREFLPYGFGFAAGAMIYLVAAEMVPEALERGRTLAGGGHRELALGLFVGFTTMMPLMWVAH